MSRPAPQKPTLQRLMAGMPERQRNTALHGVQGSELCPSSIPCLGWPRGSVTQLHGVQGAGLTFQHPMAGMSETLWHV